jgi:hypothetical protein
MNAIIREECEAPVLTNETIEVHLTYLRSGFDAVQAALPVLRDKIDLLSAKVDSKIEKVNAKIDAVSTSLTEQIKEMNARIEAVNGSPGERIDKADEQRAAGDAALSAKIDALNTSLSEKIDKANEQRAAGDAVLGEKIDKLTERVLEVQGHQKAVLWVFSISSVATALVSIARTLNWI